MDNQWLRGMVARVRGVHNMAVLMAILCTGCNGWVDPTPPEICDGIDNDQDRLIDEEWDRDQDGYPAGPDCEGLTPLDCDDTNPDVHPGATEVCDNDIDEGCDGTITHNQLLYQDLDGDGYGVESITLEACSNTAGYTTISGDCDDQDAMTYPGADETTQSHRDLNCDGSVSFELVPSTGVQDLSIQIFGIGTLVFTMPPNAIDLKSAYSDFKHGSSKPSDDDDSAIIVTASVSPLNDDPDLWAAESEEQALLGPWIAFTPALSFDEPGAEITYEFDGSFVQENEAAGCDWVDVWQTDDETGEALEEVFAILDCQTETGKITAQMTHFSTYQVRGRSRLLVFEPTYLTEDEKDIEPMVSALSQLPFSRGWRYQWAGQPLPDLASALIPEMYSHTPGAVGVVDWAVTWEEDLGEYQVALDLKSESNQNEQVEILLYAASTWTGIQTPNLCMVDKHECSTDLLLHTELSQVSCGQGCLDTKLCYDFDDDNIPDPFDCLWVDVAPDPEPLDDDGDGFAERDGDCDDADATTYPDGTELCDGVDNNCNGEADGQDELPYLTWYTDADGDGFGVDGSGIEGCAGDEDQVTRAGDCDDTSADVHPDAIEVCEGEGFPPVDNDCNGTADGSDAVDILTWYSDVDGDGHGDPESGQLTCDPEDGTTATADDCDDTSSAIYPGATEVCDGADNDCDQETDEEDATDAELWYRDQDKDGHGDPDTILAACAQPDGYVAGADDCNDSEAAAYIGASEVCDEIDNDCNGEVDGLDATDTQTWYLDTDQDGYGLEDDAVVSCTQPSTHAAVSGDCDDSDASAYPGAPEQCDGADNNCNGEIDSASEIELQTWYTDQDGDGYGDSALGREDCQANDGEVTLGGDCDDNDASAYPTAEELCDDVDNDCNDAVDDSPADASAWYGDGDGDGFGDTEDILMACDKPAGYVAADGDCDDDHPSIYPDAEESCNERDDDCDDAVDEGEGIAAPPDAQLWYYDGDGDTYGDSSQTLAACASNQPDGHVVEGGDCNDAASGVHPGADESCNEVDDNCDGQVDEDAVDALLYYTDEDGDGHGDPDQIVYACSLDAGLSASNLDCDDTSASINPDEVETCNDLDDNCNGDVDEGVLTAFYPDLDDDGFGDARSEPNLACTAPASHVLNDYDCYDDNQNVFPGSDRELDYPQLGAIYFDDTGFGSLHPCDIAGYRILMVGDDNIINLQADLGTTDLPSLANILHARNNSQRLLVIGLATIFEPTGDTSPYMHPDYADVLDENPTWLLRDSAGDPLLWNGTHQIINLSVPEAAATVTDFNLQRFAEYTGADGIWLNAAILNPDFFLNCDDTDPDNDLEFNMDEDSEMETCDDLRPLWVANMEAEVDRLRAELPEKASLVLKGWSVIGSRAGLWHDSDGSAIEAQWTLAYDDQLALGGVSDGYSPQLESWFSGLTQLGAIQDVSSGALPPPVMIGGGSGAGTDLSRERFGLMSTLMGDATFFYHNGENGSQGETMPWTFDESDGGGLGGGYLGQPLGPAAAVSMPSSANLLFQWTFESGPEGWEIWACDVRVNPELGCALEYTVGASQSTADSAEGIASLFGRVDQLSDPNLDHAYWNVILGTYDIEYDSDSDYTMTFWARTTDFNPGHEVRLFEGYLQERDTWDISDASNYLFIGPEWHQFVWQFHTSLGVDPGDGRLAFSVSDHDGGFYIDDIRLYSGKPSRVLRRDFDHGIVLLNLEDTAQTVSLETTFTHIDGQVDPTVNSGEQTNEVTIEPWDGVILLR